MRTYTLVIKGSAMYADRALSDHGFGGELIDELNRPESSDRYESVVRIAVTGTAERDEREVAAETVRRLNEWFNEPQSNGLRYTPPFDLGALLLWTPDTDSGAKRSSDVPATYRRTTDAELTR
jgi:hypothetical protein